MRRNIGIFVVSTLVGLALSYSVTIVAWNLMEPRMFRCTDEIGITFFVESLDDHRQAGDALCPGWNWGEVKTARAIYLASFFSLWLGAAVAPRWLPRRWTGFRLSQSE
jgi:hypothetical protein